MIFSSGIQKAGIGSSRHRKRCPTGSNLSERWQQRMCVRRISFIRCGKRKWRSGWRGLFRNCCPGGKIAREYGFPRRRALLLTMTVGSLPSAPILVRNGTILHVIARLEEPWQSVPRHPKDVNTRIIKQQLNHSLHDPEQHKNNIQRGSRWAAPLLVVFTNMFQKIDCNRDFYISGANSRRMHCPIRSMAERPERYFSVTSRHWGNRASKSAAICATASQPYSSTSFSKWRYRLR